MLVFPFDAFMTTTVHVSDGVAFVLLSKHDKRNVLKGHWRIGPYESIAKMQTALQAIEPVYVRHEVFVGQFRLSSNLPFTYCTPNLRVLEQPVWVAYIDTDTDA